MRVVIIIAAIIWRHFTTFPFTLFTKKGKAKVCHKNFGHKALKAMFQSEGRREMSHSVPDWNFQFNHQNLSLLLSQAPHNLYFLQTFSIQSLALLLTVSTHRFILSSSLVLLCCSRIENSMKMIRKKNRSISCD